MDRPLDQEYILDDSEGQSPLASPGILKKQGSLGGNITPGSTYSKKTPADKSNGHSPSPIREKQLSIKNRNGKTRFQNSIGEVDAES